MNHTYFDCGRYRFPVAGRTARPVVMGILNVTPDSFSDGGHFSALESAVSRAEQMIADGVDIIDIGGESSRPGAMPLPLEEELARVMPVIYALRDCGKAISVDTYKPAMMRAALAAGADMINDIRGFMSQESRQAVAHSDCGLCIMHMQQNPQTMQEAPCYGDVVSEVRTFLEGRMAAFDESGVERSRICVDPGFGFGKSFEHNVTLFQQVSAIRELIGVPVLTGLSRKSMLGQITGRPVEQRLAASVAAALASVSAGASIVRVHDVAETVDALKVWQSLHLPTLKQ